MKGKWSHPRLTPRATGMPSGAPFDVHAARIAVVATVTAKTAANRANNVRFITKLTPSQARF